MNWPTPLLLAVAAALLTASCAGPQNNDDEWNDSDYHYQLAIGHYQAHEIPTAIRELLTSLEYDPTNADAMFLMGFIYHGRQDYEMAEQYYREALEIRDDWAEAWNNLGTVYLQTEDYDRAAEIFRELTRNPTYVTPGHAHNNLGWAYYNMGMRDEALEQFQLAVMFQPEHCLAYNNQGMIYEEMGNVRQAERAYESAISRCADYPEPRYRLGVILSASGDYSDLSRAHDLFQECYDASPESSYGQRCLEYLGVSRLD